MSLPKASPEPSEERTDSGSWNRLYAIVLGELALLILLFYLFTKAFA